MSTRDRSDALRELSRSDDECAAAEAHYREAFALAYPIGCEAYYRHGARTIAVRVLEHHGYQRRVRVMGTMTCREYWIDSSRLQSSVGDR